MLDNEEEHTYVSHLDVCYRRVNKIRFYDFVLFDVGILCSRLCYYLRRCFTIAIKESLVNTDIKFKEVRVIDSDGSSLGILPIEKALDAAYAKDLDLVCMAPNAQPPVCKIIDYGKYRYNCCNCDRHGKFRYRNCKNQRR